jgi:hypothetical protein
MKKLSAALFDAKRTAKARITLSDPEARRLFFIAAWDDKSMTSDLVAADPDLHAGPEGEWQAWVADGTDVLLAKEIVELGEDREA